MKKLAILLACILLLGGCSYFSEEADELVLDGEIEYTVVATTSTVHGPITEILKGVGELVKKGDIIAVVDHESQQYIAEQLEVQLQIKQATLEKLQQGARPEEIEQARAAVKVAQAKLAEIQEGARPEQIRQAEAQVRAAKAQYELAQTGTREEQIEQAKNDVLIAEEAYNAQFITYEELQTTHEKTQQLVNSGLAPQKEADAAKLQLDTAQKRVNTLRLQLNNAKQQLSLLKNSTVAEEIKMAEANMEAAQAQVDLLKSGTSTQAIAQMRAEVERAEAQLAFVASGARAQDLAIAQADLEATSVQLREAESKQAHYFLKALVDGRIISKTIELGHVVASGSHIVDIASQEVAVVVYVPSEYMHLVQYDQPLQIDTPNSKQTGFVKFIALEDEYLTKDKQTGEEKHPMGVKVKVQLPQTAEQLVPNTPVQVHLPLSD